MISKNQAIFRILAIILLILPMLSSCGIYRPVSAKDYPPEPEKRIKKNMEKCYVCLESYGCRLALMVGLYKLYYGPLSRNDGGISND